MGASGTTAFAVVYVEDVCDVSNDNGPIFGEFGTAVTSNHYPYGGDCSVYDGFASEDRKGPLTAPSTITDIWSIYSVVSTTNDWRNYVNGTLMHSDNTNVYSGVPAEAFLYIGYSFVFEYTLKGKIAEAIMYNRVLTTPERLQVEAYLTDKYAIAPAPSGIPVATTNEIVLSGLTEGWADLNGTYTKSGDPTNVFNGGVNGNATGAVYFNSAYTGGNRNGAAIWYGPILFGSDNGWQITFYDDNDYPLGSIVSADTTTVPFSGYSNAGYTGTITLSAL
jgi:hypothetical protein